VDSTYQKASVALARVTAAGQTAESPAVDLEQLAQQFENQIETWRGPVASTDSTGEISSPVTDSTTASIEAKGDTLKEDVHEE
jgi:hypothetical protein